MFDVKKIIKCAALVALTAFSAARMEVVAQETGAVPESKAAQSVIMVVDGSGSMWGQIDGVAKIEIARKVIDVMLDDWDESIELGVIAYGHREKGDCSDIETLIDVGPLDKAAVMAKVNAISPKGKTPITASVRTAAETLKYTEEKATVILVSDGLETCNADPCALASELERAGVDFTTHVIGFDINEEEKAGLACLAENTGGRFMTAANAMELTSALAETVKIVSKSEPEPEPIGAGPQGIRVSAKLCETCEVVEDNMFWKVFEDKQDLEGNRQQVKASGAATFTFELPAEKYVVRASYGKAFVDETVTVEPGELTELVVNLNAGHFRVTAVPVEGAEELKDNMFYQVFALHPDLEGNRKQIDASGAPQHVFRLPAGEYVIQARHGQAVAEETFTVTPGQLTDNTLNMNAGYLRLNAIMVDGGSPVKKDIFYRVMSPKADLEGNRKQIAASGSASEIFRLNAGDYLLRTKHGAAVKDTPVNITAGAVLNESIVMESARVKLIAVQTEGGAPVKKGLFWRAKQPTGDLEGTETQVDADGAAQPIMTLPAGTYSIVVSYGGKETRAPLTLKPGEEKEFQVVLNP